MSFLNKMKSRNEKKNPVSVMGLALMIMYVISALLLLLTALLLFQFELKEEAVKIAVAAIYMISGFSGGFFIGKQMQDKKYLWGLLAGSLYFVLLVAVSALVGEEHTFDIVRMITTMALCAISSMAGGMVS